MWQFLNRQLIGEAQLPLVMDPSLGPGVNPLNYKDNVVNFPTIPRGFGVRGCAIDWCIGT